MQKKYIEKLLSSKSLDEFVLCFGLPKVEQKSVLGNKLVVPHGTTLYRARKSNDNITGIESDFTMPPSKYVDKGRFNYVKRPVLYVGTIDSILPREIGLKANDEYYLAEFKAKSDIVVGSFLKHNDIVTMLLHKLAMAIESEEKLTENETIELNKRTYQRDDMRKIAMDQLSVFYINRILKRDLYEITNKLFNLIKEDTPCGIRYNSCYVPFELSGAPEILTLDGELQANYALTEEGAKHLEYIGCEKKIYTEKEYNNDLSLMINIWDNGLED